MYRAMASLTASLLLASGAAARLAVMTCSNFAVPGTNWVGNDLIEDGIKVHSAGGSMPYFLMIKPSEAAYSGSLALAPFWQGTNVPTTFTAAAGGRFTMVSIKISPDRLSMPSQRSVTYTGLKGNGSTVTQTFTVGFANPGTVHTFPNTFTDLVSVSFINGVTDANFHQFDDVTMIIPEDTVVTPPVKITVTEGMDTFSVPISLNVPAPQLLTLNVAAVSGTANVPADGGLAVGGGTVTFTAGQSQGLALCTLVNDTTVESPESFFLNFTTTSPGVVIAPGRTQTEVVIASDDGVLTFPNWMAAHSLVGNDALPAADPNSDGLSNVESWLFRLNPAGPSPVAWKDRLTRVIPEGVGRAAIRMTLPLPLPPDVRIIEQESHSLTSWTEHVRRDGFGTLSIWTGSGSNRVIETSSAAGRTVTISPAPAGRNAATYQRLKFEYFLPSGGGT
jgi:hypothetical protein